MEIIKKFFKGYWKIIVFCVLAVPVTALGYIVVGGGIQLVAGEVYSLVYGGTTYNLNNTTGQNIFIPNNTPEELASFVASPLATLLSGGPCVPTSCTGYCGDDGCGGTCSCPLGYTCQGSTCVLDCVPRCSSGATGESCQDGCGGLCACSPGTCDGTTCVEVGGCTAVCATNFSLPLGGDCNDTCNKPCIFACSAYEGCDPENWRCVRSPECEGTGQDGEMCGTLTSWGSICGCASGLYCHIDAGACKSEFYLNPECEGVGQIGGEGAPCGLQYGEGLFCGCYSGLICEGEVCVASIPEACVSKGQTGEIGSACGFEYEPGLFCNCNSGLTCNKGVCEVDIRCQEAGQNGEGGAPCGAVFYDPYALCGCNSPLECIDGSCNDAPADPIVLP